MNINQEEIEILEQDIKDKEENYNNELEELYKTVGWLQKDKLELDIWKKKLSELKQTNENN